MIHNAHIGIAVKRWPLGIAEMMACWGVEVKQWPVEALQWNNNQKSAKVNRWPRRRRSRKDDEKTINVGTMWTWREKESKRMMKSLYQTIVRFNITTIFRRRIGAWLSSHFHFSGGDRHIHNHKSVNISISGGGSPRIKQEEYLSSFPFSGGDQNRHTW